MAWTSNTKLNNSKNHCIVCHLKREGSMFFATEFERMFMATWKAPMICTPLFIHSRDVMAVVFNTLCTSGFSATCWAPTGGLCFTKQAQLAPPQTCRYGVPCTQHSYSHTLLPPGTRRTHDQVCLHMQTHCNTSEEIISVALVSLIYLFGKAVCKTAFCLQIRILPL